MHAVSSNIISSNCSGLRGTYQGLTATVLKQGTNQAIRFYVMNALRNWYKGEKLQNTWILSPAIFITYFSILSIKIWIYKKKGDDPRKEMHPVVTAMFGATAGAASVFGNTPLDVVKTRMQVKQKTPNTVLLMFFFTITPVRFYQYDRRICFLFH